MGLSPFGKCSSYQPPAKAVTVVFGNPDPKRYKVLRKADFPNNTSVLEVQYPDANNFEGKKILVYKDTRELDLWLTKYKELDPHFSDKYLSPFARFIPNAEGWKHAIALAQKL